MKILRALEGAYASKVELVELRKGVHAVLKTATQEDIVNEKEFFHTLAKHQLPALKIYRRLSLEKNQILLEYIKDSPTLGKNLSPRTACNWGKYLKKLHRTVIFKKPFRITEEGVREYFTWAEFIDRDIEAGIARQHDKKSRLSKKIINSLVRAIEPLRAHRPKSYVLLHGDLHANNILVKGSHLYLFDKRTNIFSGDPLYDLAMVAIGYPNHRYVETADQDYRHDHALVSAFIKGYGYDFISEDKELFERYMLLRALNRYPNPFDRHLKETMEHLVKAIV